MLLTMATNRLLDTTLDLVLPSMQTAANGRFPPQAAIEPTDFFSIAKST